MLEGVGVGVEEVLVGQLEEGAEVLLETPEGRLVLLEEVVQLLGVVLLDALDGDLYLFLEHGEVVGQVDFELEDDVVDFLQVHLALLEEIQELHVLLVLQKL